MNRSFALFLCLGLFLSLFSGCSKPVELPQQTADQTVDAAPTSGTAPTSSTDPTYNFAEPTMSDYTYPTATPSATGADHVQLPVTGSLSGEPLKILDWNSGRTNETSCADMWETEDGYYLRSRATLYYADKSDLSFWIPACANPACSHLSHDRRCNANLDGEYLIQDDQIIRIGTVSGMVEFDHGSTELYSSFLFGSALDGSGRQLLYYSEDINQAILRSGTVYHRDLLTADYMLYCYGVMNAEGLFDIEMRMVDETGEYVLYANTRECVGISSLPANSNALYGDLGFFTNILETPLVTTYCRIKDHTLVVTDLSGLPYIGAYASGDTLRAFYPGDGYYDIDLNTREEVKLADAQLTNSLAHIVLPNCILESTLIGDTSEELRGGPEGNAIKLFDGEKWMDVSLPGEIANMPDSAALHVVAVTSDRIVLQLRDSEQGRDDPYSYYQIMLETDQPALEHMADIG